MKPYELALILHPDLEIDLDAPLAKLDQLIKDAHGKVSARDDWGKRKLSYPIAGMSHGIYCFYQLEMEPGQVANLERHLLIADEVLRHLVVKPAPVEPEAKKKPAKTKAKPEPAKASAEKE